MLKFKQVALLLVFLISLIGIYQAQILEPVEWEFTVEETGENKAKIVAKCSIESKWHVYATVISDDPEVFGPMPTTLELTSADNITNIGKLKEGKFITHYDPNFEMDLNYFEDNAEFSQEFQVMNTTPFVINGELNYMACDDSKCIFPEPILFHIKVNGGDKKYDLVMGEEAAAKSNSQIFEPAKWTFSSTDVGGGKHDVTMTCTLDAGWHVYSQDLGSEMGPIPSSFHFEELPAGHKTDGPTKEGTPIIHWDPNFEMDLAYFDNSADFTQTLSVDGDPGTVKGWLEFMVCNDERCLPPEIIDFEVNLATGKGKRLGVEAEEGAVTVVAGVIPATPNVDLENPEGDCNEESQTQDVTNPWKVFLLGFLGGLVALITPCVFPMIPMTVAFFTKGSDSSSGIGQAVLYGFFIFLIYALLSVPFHFGIDPGVLNKIATGIPLNLVFFVIFIVFAISFFGYFEITLPSGLVNKMDSASNVGGIIGIFFMAVTLALVSFSCTGPILGTVLGNAIKNGPWPITAAMSGFGIALGLPFALFASFPKIMKKLPQSGGWLNSTKVVLAFIEIGLAIKFFSNADLVAQWGLLKRETFFLLWAILAFGLALYLFGKIKFPHDSPLKKIKPIRMGLGIAVLAFGIYLAPGVLKHSPWNHNALSGFPPPTFYSWYEGQGSDDEHAVFHSEFDDYDEALAHAKEVGKPLLVDFTGWACVNCRKMEEAVWTDPGVQKILSEDYVLVSLYVDDREELPEDQQGIFSYDANGETRTKRIKTVGDKWATLQTQSFNNNSQPYYVMLSNDGKLLGSPIGYLPDVEAYTNYLKCGLEANK